MLKFKIDVNLSQLFCIVFSAAQMTDLNDLLGFALTNSQRMKNLWDIELTAGFKFVVRALKCNLLKSIKVKFLLFFRNYT